MSQFTSTWYRDFEARKAAREVTGTKGKALDAKIAEILAGMTETKTSEPILTQV